MSYDAAGNLINDTYPFTGGQRTYDAENRMTQAWANNQWQIYTYNADGQRVRRKVDGFETWQVYGMEGELIAEYAANAAPTSPQKEYGYRNGQLLITASPGTSSVSTENVSWTDLVGVSASGNSLTKTAAAGWNAGAISTQAIASGDGYVEFTASADLTDRLCGLSVGNSGQGSGDIDFAINLSNGGFIYALEGGVLKANGGSYATGDLLRVAVVSGVVKYSKNGSVFYTSSVTPSYPLLVDTALYTNGAMVSNALLSGNLISTSTENVSWTDLVGVSASGNSLTKTAAAGWNAGAISTQAIASGDGYVEFTASADLTDRLCGLSVGNSGQGSGDVDFAIYLSNGGFIYAFEGGVEKANGGSYATGDHLRVTVASGVVKYSKNGSVFYTSSATLSYPLLVDTALYPTGSTISNVIISGNLDGGASAGADSIQWLVPDHLGTPRMIFDQTGSLANTKRHDYLPFGEELALQGLRSTVLGYGGDGTRQKLTSKERDNETGLDFFAARYYASIQGRFASSDSFQGFSTNPQTLNLYAYVQNNPLKFTDPTGHRAEIPGLGTTDIYFLHQLARYAFLGMDPPSLGVEVGQEKKQEPEDTIKINTNEANILDFDLDLSGTVKDKYGKEGIPIGGEFGIYYKFYIPVPPDGTKPEVYGGITPIIPKTGGRPRGTFSDASYVELKSTRSKVNRLQEGVTVETTERYVVKKDPHSNWGGTYQINYRIAVTNPKTEKTVDRSSVEERSGFRGRRTPQPVPVLVVPKR